MKVIFATALDIHQWRKQFKLLISLHTRTQMFLSYNLIWLKWYIFEPASYAEIGPLFILYPNSPNIEIQIKFHNFPQVSFLYNASTGCKCLFFLIICFSYYGYYSFYSSLFLSIKVLCNEYVFDFKVNEITNFKLDY